MAVEDILSIAMIYGGVVLVACWLAMIIWAYRDMRARSRDSISHILVGVMVAVLTLPGILIYIFLRPRETLAEAYERSLEEEALLQEIEEKPTCPTCTQRVQADWQACPYCNTRLKKPCVSCNSLLELSWNLCPYCTASQVSYGTAEKAQSDYAPRSRSGKRAWQQEDIFASQQAPENHQGGDSLEFVEEDDY